MKPARGVVIGKFLPPHRGHELLIQTGLAGCRRLTVFVCERPEDPIPGPVRAGWLSTLFPEADVRVIDDRYDAQDSRVWAENTIRWLPGRPDVVFTSEAYGEPYAACLGCRHQSVDPARARVPVSGTAVRADPYAQWAFISPPVRGWYAKRVCVLGAESTGTTTLAQALSTVLRTPWVEEYGREYSEAKQQQGETAWSSEEFTRIAEEQNRREDEAATRADRLLICDTNSFATRLWHRRYMGHESMEVARVAARARCDLYLLTGDEIPFVQDGLRDGEHLRHDMHQWFVAALAAQSVPWQVLRGSPAQRLQAARMAIAELFAESVWKPRAD